MKWFVPFAMMNFEEFLVFQLVNHLSAKYGSGSEEEDETDLLLQDYAEAIVEAYMTDKDLSAEERNLVENAEDDYSRFLRVPHSLA